MFDFGKGEYVPARLSDFPSLTVAMSRETRSRQKMEALLSSEGDDPAARFARGFFYSTLAYGLRMVGEICDDITDIDTALKHGFNWPAGLFERAQQVGLETCLEGMEAAGCGDMVPDWYRGIVAGGGQLYDEPAGTFYSWTGNRMDSLPSVAGGIYPGMLRKSAENVLFANDDAAVLDISDDSGQVCLVEITARALGHGPIEAGHRALDWAEQQQAAVVFGSSGPHFGFGADLQLFHRWSEDGEAQTISNLIRAGQEFTQRVEYSSCPTVAAIQGMCLGGASELALACNRRVANGSLNIGQPELNVGVIPAWGGLMRLCRRMERGLLPSYLWGESMTVTVLVEHLMEVLRLYSRIVTSSDAYHAREVGFLNDHDIIVPAQGLGQPFVLKRAKEVAQSMLLAGFRPGPPFLFNLPGKEGFAEFKATAELGSMQDRAPVGHPEHNTKCATLAARVLCGGESNNLGTPVDEQTLLDLEHDGFMEVVMTEEARDYIRKIINR
jgi:3-hydroxyacyl-CoA dehydrogenase